MTIQEPAPPPQPHLTDLTLLHLVCGRLFLHSFPLSHTHTRWFLWTSDVAQVLVCDQIRKVRIYSKSCDWSNHKKSRGGAHLQRFGPFSRVGRWLNYGQPALQKCVSCVIFAKLFHGRCNSEQYFPFPPPFFLFFPSPSGLKSSSRRECEPVFLLPVCFRYDSQACGVPGRKHGKARPPLQSLQDESPPQMWEQSGNAAALHGQTGKVHNTESHQ